MRYLSSKSEPEKSTNLKPDVRPWPNKILSLPLKMTISPNNFLKEDTKLKKSDQAPFKSNKETHSSLHNSAKSIEAWKFKSNFSKKKDTKVPNSTKHTSKNCN